MVYNHVRIENYEGPIDLLLELIERNNLDITRFSLAKIAEQYLNYLENHKVKIEYVIDFLEVATKLAFIKSKILLPKEQKANRIKRKDEEKIEDFEKRIRLYALFRNLSKQIGKAYLKNRFFEKSKIDNIFLKNKEDFNFEPIEPEEIEKSYQQVTQKFLNNYLFIKKKKQKLKRFEIKKIINIIKKELEAHQKISFFKFIKKFNKPSKVNSFLAFLEICRNSKIKIYQQDFLSDIVIKTK
jgi:segregation and condensation protein A